MKNKPWLVPIVAILTIGALEALALSQGINGTLMSMSMAAISGIAGYQLKKVTIGVEVEQ